MLHEREKIESQIKQLVMEDQFSTSLGFAIALEGRMSLVNPPVENVAEMINSHAIESVMIYLDISDRTEMDLPLILKHLRGVAKLRYSLQGDLSSYVDLSPNDKDEYTFQDIFGFTRVFSKNHLEALRSDSVQAAHTKINPLIKHYARSLAKDREGNH